MLHHPAHHHIQLPTPVVCAQSHSTVRMSAPRWTSWRNDKMKSNLVHQPISCDVGALRRWTTGSLLKAGSMTQRTSSF
eukprot:9312273-Pyramimonas_sp.AAC.1